jgi:hypothetical protein
MTNARQLCTLGLLFASIAPVSASPCKCRRPEKGDQTRWGGNEMIVQVPEKHYREVAGVIESGDNNPTTEILVEVYDNPAYLLDGSAVGSHPNQKLLRACVTGDDGLFCFRNLPSGKYEIRASLSTGIDVTHVYAVVDTKHGSKEPIEVRLHVGT